MGFEDEGARSWLKIPQNMNQLWNTGGVMYGTAD
jgi:hypothetical protein